MNFDFLEVSFTDSIRSEPSFDFDRPMSWDNSLGWDVGKGGSWVCVQDSSSDFLQAEVNIKVANIFDLDSFFHGFLDEDSPHVD